MNALTFIDESINSDDDGIFMLECNQQTSWRDSPRVRHGQSATLSFADGHAELWRWQSLKIDQSGNASAAANLADLARLQNAIYTP